jgi:hypothetical protein
MPSQPACLEIYTGSTTVILAFLLVLHHGAPFHAVVAPGCQQKPSLFLADGAPRV